MAKQKKNIARLVLQGISVLGILSGIGCFLCAIVLIFPFPREDLIDLFFMFVMSLWMLVLGAFLTYPSYQMLRGRSFLVIKSMAALLALDVFGLLMIHAEDFNTFFFSNMPIEIKAFAELVPFLLSTFVSVLIYKICKKLLDRLVVAAYGPEAISETKPATEKQST